MRVCVCTCPRHGNALHLSHSCAHNFLQPTTQSCTLFARLNPQPLSQFRKLDPSIINMSRQDPGRPPNFGEMCEWAERNFPIEFACFQAKVDNMMTPKELPYGWDPNYPQTPKPLLRDWISPTDTDRSALSFQSHLCLNIGYYQQPGRKLDQLHVFSAQTDTINMFFCREIKSDSKFVRVQPSRAMNDKGLVLYPLWNALRKSETDPENCGLIRTAALWLHVQRMLVPDFRGIHACKERFKAVCVAWTTYASSHPHCKSNTY